MIIRNNFFVLVLVLVDFVVSQRRSTHTLTELLDRLTNSSTYDKRLRPKYGSAPVDVGITIHVSSISAVSEVDMDFTLDFYLRQTWQDPRLAFDGVDIGNGSINSLTVGVDYLEKLWKPDTFFPNEKKSYFHLATTHNSFLRIESNGTVFTSQRLTVTATCPMDLQLFPMDSQHCKLEIESYGYNILDIVYVSHQKGDKFDYQIELPQFVLQKMDVISYTKKLSSGEYSRLIWYFLFRRNIGFYIIQIYLPSILIVVISWVSFWLNREATPARVALGVTTVLTMTTLMTMTNSSMPKVSYVKSIDIFLGVCFMMVFCSLLEYAAVGYISKRLKLVRARREADMRTPSPRRDTLAADLPPPPKRAISVPAYFNNQTYRPFYSSTDRTSNLYIPEAQRTSIFVEDRPITPNELTPMLHNRSASQNSILIYTAAAPLPYLHDDVILGPRWRWARPSNIDKYSRNGYQTADIDYYWGKTKFDDQNKAVAFDAIQLPQFAPSMYLVNVTNIATSSGRYVRLALHVVLVRNMGFYTMNIVIPSILIVTISWVSFWLNREASPARVGLGVTTVLTMTTLITTTNNSMPKVSYVKGLDVFLNFCFVMVFASLLEYAIVSYMNKRLVLRREKRRKAAEQQQRNEVPMFHASPKSGGPNNNSYEMTLMSQNSTPAKTYVQADLYFAGHNSSMNPLMEIPENCDCRTIPMMQHPRLVTTDGAGHNTLWPAPFAKPKKASKTCCQRWTPAKIDKLSRYCFPLAFSVFNIVYWISMKYLSLHAADDLDNREHGHSMNDVEYNWCGLSRRPNCTDSVRADSVELASYKFVEICKRRTVAVTSSGSYSRLAVIFVLDRQCGFYFLQIFFPASLVVVLSWISFWISRDSAPSRTLIGTMTILTETHLMTGTNRRLPPVGYVKAVDIFLGFCYLSVVLALIEYACVAYSKKKNEDRRRKEKKTEHKPAPPTPDILHDVRLAECTCNAAPTSIIAVIKQPNSFCVRHSHVDIFSRIMFPVVFTLFNIIYWTTLLYQARRLPYISEHEEIRC
ncbi:unnamed protein product [Caenorhabditis angaria]|uniref:Gamma-aminobutyric acid receptor subunit beta n=1 Tax=Caenorhabditis angaria TaxID=860376 RepID=A0A9P1MYG2_9PELO|nr:unnamed protein product [Caenorhabditis angaria]